MRKGGINLMPCDDMESHLFWNAIWNKYESFELDCSNFRKHIGKSENFFINLIGDVKNKKILEIGGGRGVLTVYLAKMGAKVTVVDSSDTSIDRIKKIVQLNRVASLVDIRCCHAQDLNNMSEDFDIVLGEFILHHIEPFEAFSEILFKLIRPNGKFIFLENSSKNQLLMFFRHHFTGKYGIPKYGDKEEYPFEPREIDILRKKSSKLTVYYPEFMFFHLIGVYVFKDDKNWCALCDRLDELCYHHLSFLRKFSYRQVLEFEK